MTFILTGCDFWSGWIAGMSGLVVGHPIDTLKVRQQILGKPVGESVVSIYRVGGVLTFFRGMGIPLLTTGAMNSVYFGFYGNALDYLSRSRERKKEASHKHPSLNTSSKRLVTSNERHQNVNSYWDYFFAGCIGGAAQLSVATPVDFVKVQLQSQIQKSAIKGPMDCVVNILRTKGIFGLYKGFTIQALRDIPSFGLYVTIYEYLKQRYSAGHQEPSKLVQFMAGGVAGTISWWSIVPLDVIKSRIQGEPDHRPSQYKGVVHCGSTIWKSHGFRGFFHGFLPLSIRAFPVNGTTFLVYEYLFHHCKQFENGLRLES